MTTNKTDVKLVLLGSKNVGKTSLFNRYLFNEFSKTSMTMGAYFGVKTLRIQNKQHNIAIWDTAGEERFDSLTAYYTRGARAGVVCFDLTSYSTFEALPRWISKIHAEADADCAIVLLGTKSDLVDVNPGARQVDAAEARRYATSIKAEYFEVSSKLSSNVTKAFNKVIEQALMQSRVDKANNSIDLNTSDNNNQKNGKCC